MDPTSSLSELAREPECDLQGSVGKVTLLLSSPLASLLIRHCSVTARPAVLCLARPARPRARLVSRVGVGLTALSSSEDTSSGAGLAGKNFTGIISILNNDMLTHFYRFSINEVARLEDKSCKLSRDVSIIILVMVEQLGDLVDVKDELPVPLHQLSRH